MSIVEGDSLPVVLVTAAAASAALARATDTTRGPDDRRLQLEALKGALVEAGRLLSAGRRSSPGSAPSSTRASSAPTPPVALARRRCVLAALAAALTRSGRIAIRLRCGRVHERPPGDVRCAEPASVTVGGTTAEQRVFCRSHAAAARQEDCHMEVVLASRPDRTALEEAARRSAVVGTRGPARASRGRDA